IQVVDHIIPVTTKGRPQVATRIKSSIEVAMETKKQRTCGYCKEKGHYSSGCKKRKSTMLGGLTAKGIASIATPSSSAQEFKLLSITSASAFLELLFYQLSSVIYKCVYPIESSVKHLLNRVKRLFLQILELLSFHILERNIEYPRALLYRSIAQVMRTTTKRIV
nr:protein FAR1-related sequence 5-like [Tanacetum cinerariifolium]